MGRAKTIQEFMAKAKAPPKNVTKKQREKKDRLEKSKKRTLLLNKNSIIIGFDAGVEACGICAYDVQSKRACFIETLHYNDVDKWLDKVIELFGSERLYARVEVGDRKTAYGRSYGMMNSKDKATQKKGFSIISSSGSSSILASMFINLLERKRINFEVIKSSERFNVKERKKGQFKNYSGSQILSYFQRYTKTSYPSKLNANQITSFYRS